MHVGALAGICPWGHVLMCGCRCPEDSGGGLERVLGLWFTYGDEPLDWPKLLLALFIISEGWVEWDSSPARNAHFPRQEAKHSIRRLANSI